MRHVAVLAYEGCWAMGVFSAADFFRIVTLLDQHAGVPPRYQVHLLSVDGAPVRAAGGHVLQPDAAACTDGPHPAPLFDLVVVPAIEGVRLAGGFVPDARLVDWLAAQRRAGAQWLALTTGACFVAATGLCDGALLATHWAFVRPLAHRYPGCQFVAHPSCLQAQGVWSTGSLNGGFDALLEIVAAQQGDAFAQLCAAHLLVAAPAQVLPLLAGHRNHCDAQVLQAQEWAERHYAQAPRIAAMAAAAGLSERTFKRRFAHATGVSPNVYVQKVRVDKAKKLLLSTEMAVKSIAYEVGYENVGFFVRVFKAQTGQTPGQWRCAGPAND